MKKRQRKKVFKLVAKALDEGRELNRRHKRIVQVLGGKFFDRLYVTEFRPWWYEQDWQKCNLRTEFLKFAERAAERFGNYSGINMELWKSYIKR